MYISGRIYRTKKSLPANWLLAITALLLAGAAYRLAASRLKLVTDTPIALPLSLSNFPKEINGWLSRDTPLPGFIRQAADNDDFLYRFCEHQPTGRWVNIYVAYSGRPRTMLGHRPQVCYVANGWVHDGSLRSEFLSYTGKHIPCSIHRFHKPGFSHEEVVVLNFYVHNGRITRDENDFSAVKWRTPNIAGNPANYIAQVQLSSILENSVRAAAKDITDSILDFLPDSNGTVKAIEYIDSTGAGLK